MALPRDLPISDPGRKDERPEDVREYSQTTGSWTRDPNARPVPGTPKDGDRR
ncbi:hypothetical protein [Streptomyces violens]|uniref:hypothetical protein n=1 Tax=Streptomyces violens TaxID=66377 RepID=UPI000B077F51|nr:hypothetical protein [Streptomyces violens]